MILCIWMWPRAKHGEGLAGLTWPLGCCKKSVYKMNGKKSHKFTKKHVDFTFSWQGNHNGDAIAQRIETLQKKIQDLATTAERRKAKLDDNSAFLQFIWKTDVVESWIGKRTSFICMVSCHCVAGFISCLPYLILNIFSTNNLFLFFNA